MRKSGVVTVLVLSVVLFVMLPVCPELPSSVAAGTIHVPGGCHGHRGPMPAPAHMCCYATHQALATVPIAASRVLLNVVLGCVSSPNCGRPQQHIPAAPGSSDVSPPLTTILRI